MAEYSNLSATINAQIRANGVQAITGPVLNAVLTAMVNVLGDGYRLNGVAVPADNPGSPDNRVAYLAAQDGTYTNFGGLTISGEVALLLWDSAWTKEVLFSIDTAVTPGSGHLVTSGAVDDALTTLAGNIAAAYMRLVPGATEGNLAEFDNAGQVRDAGVATADIATKDGAFPDLFAGFAGNLVDTRSAGTPQGPYAFRQSGGDGVDYMRRIKGRTEAFNQMVKNGNFADTSNWFTAAGTISVSANILTWSGASIALFQPGTFIIGHYYYVAVDVVASSSFTLGCGGSSDICAASATMSRRSVIVQAVADNDTIFVYPGSNTTMQLSNFICVDLTLEGLGFTTADQFRALHPLPYYNYNAGVLKNNAATGIKTRGFNQWDEEWETGVLDNTGSPSSISNSIRSKNFCKMLPNTNYYLQRPSSSSAATVYMYDSMYNFIEYKYDQSFISSANAAYFKVSRYNQGAAYNHDICINLSDASRNGTYEPYWERTLQLGITTRKDTDGNVPFADGMKGAGTAADWCDKVGGEIVMGEVDLGSLSWQYSSAFGVFRTASAVPNMKNSAQIICSKYATDNVAADQLGDKEISSVPSFVTGGIMIKDSSYGTDPAAFKTAMNGVKMVFEKDAPVPFTWAEPLNLGVEVDNLGTEERLPADTADNPQGGFESDSNYSVSTANLVRLLNL